MSEVITYSVPAAVAAHALIDNAKYQEMYQASIDDPEAFWGEHGKRLDWIKPYTRVKNTSFAYDNVTIEWFADGTLNVAANCIDRHLATRADQTAIIWEADDPTLSKHITYRELHARVGRFANVLKGLGVAKGDRVILYMPMIPEAAYAMLACARIGAVHSVVFGGFSADSLAERIQDTGAKLLVTQDGSWRKGAVFPLKEHGDVAVAASPSIEHVVVVERASNNAPMTDGRDVWWHDLVDGQPTTSEPEVMNAEDLLYILYTSGTTGTPKGIVHTQGG